MRVMTEVPKTEVEKKERRGYWIYTSQLNKEEESPQFGDGCFTWDSDSKRASWRCDASRVRVCRKGMC